MTDEEIEERARYIISAAASNNQRLDEICIKSYVAGAHWMQDNHPLLTDIRDGKALAVDKGWLDRHERNVSKLQLMRDIEKACELYRKEVQQCKNMLNYFKTDAGDIIDIERSVDIFREAMEEEQTW